ncbi:uncharacterized protein [Montipora capricornis]|uniref:uncharacterized protein n=1 Tax=Montipora capricornis TaxID=246305 RepID=UPI0035F127BF
MASSFLSQDNSETSLSADPSIPQSIGDNSQGNNEPDGSDTKTIFESEGKLAFVHHKKVVNHCQDALWYRAPKDAPSYVDLGAYMFQQTDEFRLAGSGEHRKVATIYPAWQRCGTFVVDSELQIDPDTRTCLPTEQRYVLYENSWKKKGGKGASSEQTIKINIRQPFSTDGLRDLLVAFKGLLENNYPASCMALGGTVMSLGYQRIVQAGGLCPVALLTGDTETSKTTVLKACISLTGTAEVKDFTAKKALERSKMCDIPFAWDDPTDKDDVKFIVQALFNQAGKDTVQPSGYPRSPPVISANFACANDKRIFSRKAILLFERPNPQHPSQVMAIKKAELDLAAKKASTGFMEALCIIKKFLDPSSMDERTLISNEIEKMFPGRIRSPEIYSKLMWFTCEVMKVAGMEEDVPDIWEYLESKIAPFIVRLFSGVQDSSSALQQSACCIPKSVWEILKDLKQPLSKKEAATAFKTTNVSGKSCLAIAHDVAVTFLKQKIEGQYILKELKKLPNATKGRLHFLSPDSEVSYFKISKGKDVFGKSVFRHCVSIPLDDVPGELLRLVQEEDSIQIHNVAGEDSIQIHNVADHEIDQADIVDGRISDYVLDQEDIDKMVTYQYIKL